MEKENNKIIVSDGKSFTHAYTLTSQFQKQNRNSYPYYFHHITCSSSSSSYDDTLLILSPSHVTSINLSTSTSITYTLPPLPFLTEQLICMTGVLLPTLPTCINILILTRTKLHSLYITENNDVLFDATLLTVNDISTTTTRKQLHNISFTTCHPFNTYLILVLSNNYIITLKHLDKVCKDNEMIINEIITKIRRPFKKDNNVCTSKVNYNYKNGVLIESYCYCVNSNSNNNNNNGGSSSSSAIECNIANVMMFDNGNDNAHITQLSLYKDKYCALIYDNGLVYVVDMMILPWKIIRSFKCMHGRVVSINFTCDGVLCLISTEDNDVYVVNINSGDVECILQGHTNYVSHCNSILLSSRNYSKAKATTGTNTGSSSSNNHNDMSKYFSYTNTPFEEVDKYQFMYQLWMEDKRSLNIRDSVKALMTHTNYNNGSDRIRENEYIIITAGTDGVVNSYTLSIKHMCNDTSTTNTQQHVVVACKGEVDVDYLPVVCLQEAKFIGSKVVFQHEKVHCVVSNDVNRKPICSCYMSSDLKKMFVVEKENNFKSSFNIRIYVNKYKNINKL